MGVACGRYAPYGYSHPEEPVLMLLKTDGIMATGKFLFNHKGVKIELSQGVIFRLSFRHKGYLSIAKKWDWLHKNYILSLLSKNRKDWLRHYRK